MSTRMECAALHLPGFIFICGRSRRGTFQIQRKTRRDRMREKLRQIKEALRRRMHEPMPAQGAWLRQVVRGYFAYHAVPTNSRALGAFRQHVTDLWRRTLRRRSQNLKSCIHGPTSALPSAPKVGARSPNWARRDLLVWTPPTHNPIASEMR